MASIDNRKMHEEARDMLERLGIVIADTRLKVENLSGGQRQSIAIGRACALRRNRGFSRSTSSGASG